MKPSPVTVPFSEELEIPPPNTKVIGTMMHTEWWLTMDVYNYKPHKQIIGRIKIDVHKCNCHPGEAFMGYYAEFFHTPGVPTDLMGSTSRMEHVSERLGLIHPDGWSFTRVRKWTIEALEQFDIECIRSDNGNPVKV